MVIYNELINLSIIVSIMVVLILSFIIFFIIYKKYVIKNSLKLKKLAELNSRYAFKEIPEFNLFHYYDNENMYDDISTKDFLTYELQSIKIQVLEAISDTKNNSKNYKKYLEEYNLIRSLSYDTSNIKVIFLFKWFENIIMKKRIKKPCIELNIFVELYLTNINGDLKARKSRIFDSREVYDLIYSLNKKRGNFYLVPEIWQSLCKVERGKVSNKLRFLIYERDNYRCRICGRSTDDLEIDHICPISKGGKSTIDNLQTLCHSCNVNKGSNY